MTPRPSLPQPEADPYAEPCPTCGVGAGSHCRRPSGHSGPFVAPHAARRRAAETYERISPADVSWLVGTPAGDINFKNALARASVETLREALRRLAGKQKTKGQKIEARIRALEKEA